MKSENVLTVGKLKHWLEENKVLDDTPIGIYIGDSERGAVAYGVVGDTEEVINEKTFESMYTELSGHHCYCKNGDLLDEIEKDMIVMITDGFHYGEIDQRGD